MPFLQAYVWSMDRKSRLKAALFGIKAGVVWVAEDAIVTRQHGGILVERWVGQRHVSVLVRDDSTGTMRKVWEKLNEIAITDLPGNASP
jgi:hypothetical protein